MKKSQTKQMSVDFIDLLIIFGIVFDSYAYRIDYGCGYYDQYLSNKKIKMYWLGIWFSICEKLNSSI